MEQREWKRSESSNLDKPGLYRARKRKGTSTISKPSMESGINMPTRESFWRADLALGLLVVVATILAYQQTWHAGYIWDDDMHLTQNPCIVGVLGFKGIWTTSAAMYYPLVLTNFWLQHALWGLNPLPYHILNVLMHAACALLFWKVLRELRVRGAWLGAVVWSLHPVMVESVAWITELKNTQSAFFYLLAILFFIKWHGARCLSEKKIARRHYVLIIICAVLAILSKSSTVILPLVLALCWWWLDSRWRWRNVAWLSPFLTISLAASAWTIWEQLYHSHAMGPEWNQSLPQRIVIAGKAIWFYLGKLCWPHPLMFIYPRWQIDALNPLAYLPVLAAAGGLFLLWRKRNTNQRYLFFAAAYFVVALFPVLGFFNVYFFRYSFVGDHFQYLASMGPIALAGAGINEVFDFFRKQTAIITSIVFGILLSGLGLLTWQQCALYANEETLYRVTISLNPSSTLARANLGALLLDRQPDEALVQMQELLKHDPNSPESHNSLGLALEFTGRFEQAVTQYKEALELNPDLAEAHDNLARAYQRMGRLEDAVAQYHAALRLDPDAPGVHGNLGTAFEQLGRFEEAAAQYEVSLRLKPDFPESYNNLGRVLDKMGHSDEAIVQFKEALRLSPDFAEAHNDLGIAFERLGRLDEAIREYSEALRLDSGFTEAAANLTRVVNFAKKRN